MALGLLDGEVAGVVGTMPVFPPPAANFSMIAWCVDVRLQRPVFGRLRRPREVLEDGEPNNDAGLLFGSASLSLISFIG